MKTLSLISFLICYLYSSFSYAQLTYDLNGLIYQIKYESEFDVNTKVVGFEKISAAKDLKSLAVAFCISKNTEFEEMHSEIKENYINKNLDDCIKSKIKNSPYIINGQKALQEQKDTFKNECTEKFSNEYELNKLEWCELRNNKNSKYLLEFLLKQNIVEVQNKSCVGYSVYRSLRHLGLNIMDPMSIYQKSRLIWASNNDDKFKNGLSSVEDAFKIDEIKQIAHIKESVFVDPTINSIQLFDKLNHDFNSNRQSSFIIVLKSDISVLNSSHNLLINPEKSNQPQVLHVILLNSMSDDFISVFDSGMDLKKSISSEYARRPVSKGSGQLITFFGKEVLDFSFIKESAKNAMTIDAYNIKKQNFIENLYGYFIIEKNN